MTLVLQKLKDAGLRLHKANCCFMQATVKYLGHYYIDSTGLHPTKDRVQAVQEASAPRDVGELKAYLGLLSYTMGNSCLTCLLC